jgi:hypothetical protein
LWGWHLCGGLKGIFIWMMHQHIGLKNEIKQRTNCSRLGLRLFAWVSTTKQLLIKNFIKFKAWMGRAEYNMLKRKRKRNHRDILRQTRGETSRLLNNHY